MTDRLPAPVRKVGDTFKSFTPGQKAVTVFAILALAIGGYFFATWASKPTYSALFSNLPSKDASAIVESLQESGTPYELANNGTTIMVPQDQVYDLRLQLSGEGLPGESDTGYALLDQQGIPPSGFMPDANHQVAPRGAPRPPPTHQPPGVCRGPVPRQGAALQPAGAGDRAPGRVERRGPRPRAGHRGRRRRQDPVDRPRRRGGHRGRAA